MRLPDRAAYCLGRADEADGDAQKSHDPEKKRMYEDIAAGWRKLATFMENIKLNKPPAK